MPPMLLWGALGLVTLWAAMAVINQRNQKARLSTLQERWGTARARKRDMTAIAVYHRAQRASAIEEGLDDRTWDDLDMDEVFSVLDRTESVVGQQVLYARLRARPDAGRLAAFEALVTRMSDDASARERAQLALGRLSAPAGYDLCWLAQPDAIESAPWHVLFPVAGVSMAVIAMLLPLWPAGVFVLVAGAFASLVARATIAAPLRVVAGAFRQLNPLVAAAEALTSLESDDVSPILGTLRVDATRLARLRRIAGWAGRDPSAAISGDLVALAFEYLNMVFWLDANALFFGARELRARSAELLRVIAAVGEVDAAISVASYRAATSGWVRPVVVSAGPAVLRDIRHPSLPAAVPNSIEVAPPGGVIITGSNMSGKSTFLRTVGLTTVLAQTINTCLASQYEAPLFVVRSCIGFADDLSSGKSYYLVEVESVLALVHAARGPDRHLMLFDELFRGTNAVERIAAAEAVLRALVNPGTDRRPSPHLVIAATHDQELVDLLEGVYSPRHFTDTIDASGLTFDYKLQPGRATTRNAIALLAQRGAPPDLVAHALARAETLDRAREADRPARR